MIKEDINNDINELYHSLNIPNCGLVYNYPGLECLNEDFPTSLKENNIIHICAYNINTLHKYPFLQYFLYKPYNDISFSFPTFIYKDDMDLLTKSMSVINVLCSSYYKDTIFKYKGFIKEEEDIYLFFDCSHMIIDTVKITEYNDLWLVIIDEIINYKCVCNYPIDDYIIDLFYNYEKLCYLTDNEESHYQMPIIGYSTCDINKIDFVATFGIPLENGILGNYYYFTDYINSFKPNYLKYGLVRCVIFKDKTKIIYDDNTNVVSEKINEWNNKWDLLFDSVLCITTESSNIKKNICVIKNYNQYFVLSVHVKNNLSSLSKKLI
jgi:hypothetical protein